jgi:hypothetical protein
MEWEKIKSLPLRQIDHAASKSDERIGKLRKTDGIGELFFVVEGLPMMRPSPESDDYSIFIAYFPSSDEARKTAKRLSFSETGKKDHIGFRGEIYGKLFTPPREEGVSYCMFILGGALTAVQRNETFDLFEGRGKIIDIVLPAGVAPLQKKKAWWKLGK